MSRENQSDDAPRTVRGFRQQPRPTYNEFVKYADVSTQRRSSMCAHLRELASWLGNPDTGFGEPVELVDVTPAHIHRFMASRWQLRGLPHGLCIAYELSGEWSSHARTRSRALVSGRARSAQARGDVPGSMAR